jgi:WD40 repeat protein/DNA-binding XRE family transcriptional regulator
MGTKVDLHVTLGELLKRYRQEADLTQKELAEMMGYHNSVVSRVERGDQEPTLDYLETFGKVMCLAEGSRQEIWATYQQRLTVPPAAPAWRQDWGEAPDVSVFYGRRNELTDLARWIVTDHCRLVAVLGMGGIGKTTLVTRLAYDLADTFDYLIWRSLRNAPPVEDVLAEAIKFCSGQPETDLPGDIEGRITLLIEQLRRHRCLLILDNAETIMQEGGRAGQCREGYEGYGRLWRRVGETAHPSCLLVTSREKPRELVLLTEAGGPVRSLALKGLGENDSRALLQGRTLAGDDTAWLALTQRYAGNPYALRQISATIQDLYSGDIALFLAEITATMFGDIRYLLEQQFSRLSGLEQEVMYWLAIEREPVTLLELRPNLAQPVRPDELLEALESLQQRSLIEQSAGRFTLQNVTTEYVINRLIERVSEELITKRLHLFNQYALIKAQAKEYVRQGQERLILKPVVERLLALFGEKGLEERLRELLALQREQSPRKPGYAAGNILNMLLYLEYDLTGYDFSDLVVWQTYLRNANLHRLNFTHADLTNSAFAETFGSTLSVEFSPDGSLVAVAANDRQIHLWQVADTKKLATCTGHVDWVWAVAFSPDGTMLASGSADRTVKLWRLCNGNCRQSLVGHTSRVLAVAWDPEGRILASGSDDQTVRLWEAESGQCTQILGGHTAPVRAVLFAPASKLLATAGDDQTIRLWDTSSNQCLKILVGHHAPLRSLAFSRDGRYLASGGNDLTLHIWEVETGEIIQSLTGHTAPVRAVRFSPAASSGTDLLASGSSDATIRLWWAQSGHCFKTLRGHTNWVRAIAFSPDGKTLVSGSEDQTVRFWEVQTGQCSKTLRGHANWVRAVAFSPNGKILAAGNENHTVQLWQVETGQCLQTLSGHTSRVRSVVFSANGDTLVSGSDDRTVRLWNIHTGKSYKTMQEHTNRVRSVAFSQDGRKFASVSSDRTIRLWDVITAECLNTMTGHTGEIRTVSFSPDGTILVSGSEDQSLRIWTVETGTCLKQLSGHTGWIRSAGFSPDGAMLASASDDHTVRLWQIETGTCLKILAGHAGPVWSVGFSLDGAWIASGSVDHTVLLWEVSTGERHKMLQGHTGEILSVAFSPDSHTLASSSRDETIKLWDIQTGACLKTLRPDRPYEQMNITNVTGLTEAQCLSLKALGAIDLADQTGF